MVSDEAPPPYVPPEKPEEPPPAYFPEEYTMAVEGRGHLVPPNMHVSHYADSNNIVIEMVSSSLPNAKVHVYYLYMSGIVYVFP